MIKLFKPTIKRKDMDSVLHTLVDESPGPGPINRELGRQLCSEFSSESALVLRSYIRALVIALKCLGLPEGSPVVISPLSPACYIYALQSLKYEICFADVDPRTGCMLADNVAALADPAPAAVLLHEPFGNVPDLQAYRQLKIPVIEDVSQSLHSSNRKFPAGSVGAVVVLSFEDDSLLCSGGGAAVTVREKRYAHALSGNVLIPVDYDLLPDINSAFVSSQLRMLDTYIEKRKEYADICLRAVMKSRHQVLNIHTGEEYTYNGHSMALLLESKVKESIKYAAKYKIETALPFQGCALQVTGRDTQEFPNSIPFIMRAILFPLYPMLSQEQLRTLVKVLSTLP